MEHSKMNGAINANKVAICNRGEVAARIIRACQELGLRTVLLHSEPDKRSRAYRMADEKINLGGFAASENYLDLEKNISAIKASGAIYIHPGFGFLSENAEFVEAIENLGRVFVGPSSFAVRQLGNKVTCKQIARELGIPMVPSFDRPFQNFEELLQACEDIGYPVLAKAAAGGGGRGMKLITSKDKALEQLESAVRESTLAFGDGRVFLEKYIVDTKHIEVQIFGKHTGEIEVFGERECSIQRRHQKVVEEAPSANLPDRLRDQIVDSAKKLATSVNYSGAGTVEFLWSGNQVYFMEVNTRLQVEHPVTEMVWGIDLVKAQLLNAMGLPCLTDDYFPRGHAIEVRIYSENPFAGGLPSTGRLGECQWAEGPGRRFETAFAEGDRVTEYYDPMIAKIITWDENRMACRDRMLATLRESYVFGVETNIPFLEQILRHDEFASGKMNTRFIESHFNSSMVRTQLPEEIEKLVRSQIDLSATSGGPVNSNPSPWIGPWTSSKAETSSPKPMKRKN